MVFTVYCILSCIYSIGSILYMILYLLYTVYHFVFMVLAVYCISCVFTVEQEVWREVALSQLLMLVEIPVLDSILSYDAVEERNTHTTTAACSNLAFKRWESVTSLFSDKYVITGIVKQ